MDTRRGRLSVGRIGGVEIAVHWSWTIIAALLVLGFGGQITREYPNLSAPAVWGLAVIGSFVFFASVLFHEMAHALTARARGIEVNGITLFLFGGATEADASSRSARDEFVIAIVGPLASLFLAIVLGASAVVLESGPEAVVAILGYLAWVNFILAVFNMTPGLPLDGGRVFRSIVWGVTGDFQRATNWAASAGVLTGYLLMMIGLLGLWQGSVGGLWLVAIGWMISQSARSTQQHENLRETFKYLTAGDVMSSPVTTIGSELSAAEAVRSQFAHQDQSAFPVVDRDEVIGMVTLSTIRQLPAERRASTGVGELATPVDPTMVVAPATPMLDVIEALSNAPRKGRVLVLDGGQLVGIISPSDVLRRSRLADLLEPSPTAR